MIGLIDGLVAMDHPDVAGRIFTGSRGERLLPCPSNMNCSHETFLAGCFRQSEVRIAVICVPGAVQSRDGRSRTRNDRYVSRAATRTPHSPSFPAITKLFSPKGPRILSGLVDLYGYRFDAARALDGGRKAWAPAQTGIMTSLRSDDEGANGMGEREG